MPIAFDKYELRGAYHWQWYESNRFDYRSRVQMMLKGMEHSGTALDIGCGDGLITYKLFEHGLTATGIDNNAAGIQLAKTVCAQHIYRSRSERVFWTILSRLRLFKNERAKRYEQGQLRFVVGSALEFHLDQPFDYVVCHEVIEHVETPEKLLSIIRSLTRRYAIVSTPNGEYKTPDAYDYCFWTPDEFAKMLNGSKFEFMNVTEKSIYVKLYP